MKLLLKWLGTAAILNVVGHTAGANEPAKAMTNIHGQTPGEGCCQT